MSAVCRLQLARDYGHDVVTAVGARAHLRSIQPRAWAPQYASAGLYVAAVRRHAGWSRADCDGRLIAMGWCRFSPREWVDSGHLDRWQRYWRQTAVRPTVVGSDYNRSVGLIFQCFLLRIPSWIAASAPERVLARLRKPLTRSGFQKLVLMARAARRASTHRVERMGFHVSSKLLVALGRFSVEEQDVALNPWISGAMTDVRPGQAEPVLAPDEYFVAPRVIRIRDIDWAHVARIGRQLRDDRSGRFRAALAYHEYLDRDGDRIFGRRFSELTKAAGIHLAFASAWLSPAYPRIGVAMAARIALGESPVQISGGCLTKREAHLWLSDGGTAPLFWLCQHHQLPYLRSWTIVRWAIAVQADPARWSALTRARTFRSPTGQMSSFRYIDRIDELQDEDLVAGPRSSVDAAFESAACRAGSNWLERNRSDHRVLAAVPEKFRPYRKCMHALITPAQLVREGDDMGHCVGSYVSAVEERQSVIFAINVLGHRSTLELSPEGRIAQHRGPRNSEPHRLCGLVVQRFLRRSGVFNEF